MNNRGMFSGSGSLLILFGALGTFLALAAAGAGLAYADKPNFCGSCHSMQHVYTTWQASNHKQAACGDCHIPQDSLTAKLYVKGENGMRHTYHEVLRDYPEKIAFTTAAKSIADRNCLRCHVTTVENTRMARGGESCIKCHRGMVHGQNVMKGGIPVE